MKTDRLLNHFGNQLEGQEAHVAVWPDEVFSLVYESGYEWMCLEDHEQASLCGADARRRCTRLCGSSHRMRSCVR